jgi:hypothetical protein
MNRSGSTTLSASQYAFTGGCASMLAAICTHPVDLLKVRMQLFGELDRSAGRANVWKTIKHVWSYEGISNKIYKKNYLYNINIY